MVATARRDHPEVDFRIGALEDLPLPDGGAAGLLAWYSLIHTAPDRMATVVREIHRVLAPGGWLLAAFQAGGAERVDVTAAYGHAVAMTSYRHDPERPSRGLSAAVGPTTPRPPGVDPASTPRRPGDD